MGKSFKKTPIIKDNGRSKKTAKKIANHKVRARLKNLNEADELANGNSYKKVFNSYNIADYVSYWTEEDARTAYYKKATIYYYMRWGYRDPRKALENFLEEYPTVEDYLNKVWAPTHKRK